MIVEFPDPDSLAECLIADEFSRLRDEVKALRAERDALLQQIVADYPPIEAELEEVSDLAFKAEAERDALLSLIADDAFAASFQSLAQYRSALLKETKGGGNG